jgi:hypothetical protein
MMRHVALAALLLTAACTGKPSFDDPALTDRQLDLETFFDGTIVAQGQFQDIFGKARRSFEVTVKGDWNGERLRLVEDFVYEDGSTEQRVWTLVKTGPVAESQTWQGTAPGVIGVATGQEDGNRFNWRYTIDLPVPTADGPAEPVRVTFDDWMWQLSDRRVLNRAYMQRFGVDIGDVIISFEKLR